MALVTFQVAIVTTGTAQQLPSNSVLNSITLSAKAGNTASVSVGSASTVTSTTGYILAAGATVTIPCRSGNTNEIWIEGTSADVVSVIEA